MNQLGQNYSSIHLQNLTIVFLNFRRYTQLMAPYYDITETTPHPQCRPCIITRSECETMTSQTTILSGESGATSPEGTCLDKRAGPIACYFENFADLWTKSRFYLNHSKRKSRNSFFFCLIIFFFTKSLSARLWYIMYSFLRRNVYITYL